MRLIIILLMGQVLAEQLPIQHWPINIQLSRPTMDSDTTSTSTQTVHVVRDGDRVSLSVVYKVAGPDRRWVDRRESFCLSTDEWRQLLPTIQKAVQ
jgi:hypothetical protein